MTKQKKRLIKLSISSGIVLMLLLIMVLLKGNQKACEFLFNYLSLNIIFSMAKISSLVNISFYEVFLYLSGIFIILSLTFCIINLAKKRVLKAVNIFLCLILTASTIGSIYFASAGFAYNNQLTNISFFDQTMSKEMVIQINNYFLDDFNNISNNLKRDEDGNIIPPYSDKELSDKLVQEYKRLDSRFTPACKTIKSSYIMSQMRIRGVFFAPFGEANINKIMPSSEKPFTMAHEMAHARGVMREDDADLTALYITLSSDDEYIRYSAYMESGYYLFESLNLIRENQEYSKIVSNISSLAKKEMRNGYDFWSKFTLLSDITQKFNDLYLRLMGQDEGVDAYVPDTGSSDEIPVIDPDTNAPIIDPDTNAPIVEIIPTFSPLQKLYFDVYDKKVNG